MDWSRTPPDASTLTLALCDPDGRIREAALGPAGEMPSLLPLVAIRCADWAEPVRERARALLRAALPHVSPEALAVLTAVSLRASVRLRGDTARELVEEALRQAPTTALEPLLASRDRATRRLGHRITLTRGHLSPGRMASIAAADGDVVIQDLYAEAALVASDAGTGDEVLLPLLGSRQSRVRSAGVTALHRTGRHGQAEPFLHDRSPLVRACARWVLRQAGTDPVALCRARCADEDVPSGAPLGLAECGTREDAALLHPLLRHPRGGVRAGAVAGLRLLEAARPEELAPLLDDPAPGVVRETVAALVPWVHRLSVDELARRLDPDRPRHVRVGAFRLLAAREGKEFLAAARLLRDDPDPKLRANARSGPAR